MANVAAWKPTVVSVELGMNDKGSSTVAQYIENMRKLAEQIKAVPARPIFFTASPLNNGDPGARMDVGNTRLHQYALALKALAAELRAPYADQFHGVLDVWSTWSPACCRT